jgi:Putative beta-barrel porin-2, OmpL-like. bbp2
MMVATTLFAQKATIGVNTGIHSSYYLFNMAPFLGGSIDYSPSLSVSVNANTSTSKQTRRKTFTNGRSIEDFYEYFSTEKIANFDFSLLYDVLGANKKIDAKLGGGVSYVFSEVRYPADLLVVDGVIARNIEGVHRAEASMLNLVLEPSFRTAPHLRVGLRGIYRTILGRGREVKPLSITVKENPFEGGSSTTSMVDILEYGLKI